MSRTLLVKHWIKSDNFVLCNLKNLDCVKPILSVSTTKSKLLIVSTRSSFIMSLPITKLDIELIPDLDFDVKTVSEKFFNPEVWTNLFTGSLISSNVCELWIVYAKFW